MSLKVFLIVVVLSGVAGIGWAIFDRLQEQSAPKKRLAGPRPASVEVAPIERGPIQLRRTFSGALESPAAFVVAPKVSGRITRLGVDLADTVRRGQIVAWLDDDEYVQLVAQATAELTVTRANFAEAESALEIATRELQRGRALRQRGVASESQFDVIQADHLVKQARVKVARAQVSRAEAAVESARIRLSYTKVPADWTGGKEQRVVAERLVNEGATVSANTPLLSIVELNPIIGVVFVPERDYARLQPGQPITLTTDAYSEEQFHGQIARIAPVFQPATRQARVELVIDNPAQRLKPGMFVRATVPLERIPEATIVPEQALTTRDEQVGVFIVNADGRSVRWCKVTIGIQEGSRVQVEGEHLTGRVVTLGQQLVHDGSAITIPAAENNAEPTKEERS